MSDFAWVSSFPALRGNIWTIVQVLCPHAPAYPSIPQYTPAYPNIPSTTNPSAVSPWQCVETRLPAFSPKSRAAEFFSQRPLGITSTYKPAKKGNADEGLCSHSAPWLLLLSLPIENTVDLPLAFIFLSVSLVFTAPLLWQVHVTQKWRDKWS